MGTGFKGGTTTQHSISDNISSLKSNYSYSNGYFGVQGQGRSHTRNIISNISWSLLKAVISFIANVPIITAVGNINNDLYAKNPQTFEPEDFCYYLL